MHKRYNAQRQHIIHSLDSLLFQLCAVSFFLSPSLLAFISRLFCQFQCSKPRDIDPNRSLRFWYLMLVFFNIGSIWTHTTQGAAEGRAVVLDFVGQGYVPSKMHLLILDAFILFLQMVLTTIAYEVSVASKKQSDATSSTPSLPLQLPSPSPVSAPPNPNTDEDEPPKSSLFTDSLYIIDLRLAHILDRLRDPAHIIPSSNAEGLLPLPNTTPWPLPASLRLLIRARAEVRRRAQAQPQRQTPGSGNEEASTDTSRRIPGEMDIEDG